MTVQIEEFERDVVKGILNGRDSKQLMTAVNVDYFHVIQMRLVFQYVKKYYDKYLEVPQVDILINEMKKNDSLKKDDLENIQAFLLRKDHPTESRFRYAFQEIETQYLSRRLRVSMKEAIKHIEEGNPREAQQTLLRNTIETESFGKEVRVVDYVDHFNERKTELIKIRENPEILKEVCVPTGIEKLDYELDGGLRKGELLIWLGVPEGGKSISMQDCTMSAVEQGYKVAFFTIEMTPEQTMYRLDSRLTQIRYRLFRRSKLTDYQIMKWENKVKTIQPNMLKIIGVPEGCSSNLIEAELAKLKNSFSPDLIVVDYAAIMRPNEGKFRSDMQWEYIGSVVKNLKGLALKTNLPVMSACQLLVEAQEKSEVTSKHIGMAKQQIKAHTDYLVAIIQTSQMRALDITKLQFLKAREGAENRFIEITSDYDRISLLRRTTSEEPEPTRVESKNEDISYSNDIPF